MLKSKESKRENNHAPEAEEAIRRREKRTAIEDATAYGVHTKRKTAAATESKRGQNSKTKTPKPKSNHSKGYAPAHVNK